MLAFVPLLFDMWLCLLLPSHWIIFVYIYDFCAFMLSSLHMGRACSQARVSAFSLMSHSCIFVFSAPIFGVFEPSSAAMLWSIQGSWGFVGGQRLGEFYPRHKIIFPFPWQIPQNGTPIPTQLNDII